MSRNSSNGISLIKQLCKVALFFFSILLFPTLCIQHVFVFSGGFFFSELTLKDVRPEEMLRVFFAFSLAKDNERQRRRQKKRNSKRLGKTTDSFHIFLFLNLTLPSYLVKAVAFFLLLFPGWREVRVRGTYTHTYTHTHIGYKSPPPYRGRRADKCVSTPHPTDPSLKTLHRGRCGNNCMCVRMCGVCGVWLMGGHHTHTDTHTVNQSHHGRPEWTGFG